MDLSPVNVVVDSIQKTDVIKLHCVVLLMCFLARNHPVSPKARERMANRDNGSAGGVRSEYI